MKVKKIKYNAEYNFILIGLSSYEDDYKLSWLLEKIFKSEFIRQKDVDIQDNRFNEFQKFVSYLCSPTNLSYSIRLIVNKTNVGFIIEELKNIDYFLQIFDNDNNEFIDKIILDLKAIKSISAIFQLDLLKIKNKEKLLY